MYLLSLLKGATLSSQLLNYLISDNHIQDKKLFFSFLSFSIVDTAQKIKFSIKDFSVNVTKSAGNYGFSYIYGWNA